MAENIVVITTDLSVHSMDAISQGLQHANATDAEVRVFYVSEKFELPLAFQRQLNDPEGLHKMEKAYDEEERARLDEFLRSHKVLDKVTPVIEFSDERPSDVIRRYAADVDARLLVMASQGKGAIGRLLLGSTTQRVVARAPCPILVIPPACEEGE